jgi:LmbE family N-acetylglucosaminyl deacetylase
MIMVQMESRTILVVAAHADDEALGCGGTIARHVTEGDRVHLVLMADGVHSRSGASPVDVEQRLSAAAAAQKILGIGEVHYLGFPDNRMDSLPLLDIVQALEPVLQALSPQVVYTHHHGDLNIDHRITQQAVMTACRPQPGHSVKEIYGFEVLSSTEWTSPHHDPFLPNLFIEITAQLQTKQRALDVYAEELRPVPHSRSMEHVEALARHRGYSVGVEAAEAFVVYRLIR